MARIRAGTSVSITDFKRDPSAAIKAAGNAPMTVSSKDRPLAHLLSAVTYARIMKRLDGLELAELIRTRTKERRV